MQSLVKVTDDAWGESDFIPLFYAPKKQFWDLPDHQATDFNQDGLYYENAWMSFQGGDEVQVLLEEGVPKAVLGFLKDGPRIGENVFKFTCKTFGGQQRPDYWIQGNNQWKAYDGGATGPDGLNLHLTDTPIKLCDTGETHHTHPNPDPSNPDAVVWISDEYFRYIEWLIKLGGVAYILQTVNHWYIQKEAIAGVVVLTQTFYVSFIYQILAAPTNQQLMEDTIKSGQNNSNLDPYDIYYNWFHGTQGAFIDYPEFIRQDGSVSNFFTACPDIFVPQTGYPGENMDPTVVSSCIDLSILQKPHNPPAT